MSNDQSNSRSTRLFSSTEPSELDAHGGAFGRRTFLAELAEEADEARRND